MSILQRVAGWYLRMLPGRTSDVAVIHAGTSAVNTRLAEMG